jgi:hypothetical protein
MFYNKEALRLSLTNPLFGAEMLAWLKEADMKVFKK